ncbi:MAG: NAD(P)-dependent oxidoreductase [Chloroflexi bacterium]|nr:NAD(P)-dependent oxidoreductase [Chloroflexota bacterium]
MKIALFGVGMIGQRVAQEALSRGHEVKAIVRDAAHVQLSHPHFTVAEGNILDPDSIARSVAGYDAVVNATRQGRTESPEAFSQAAHSLIEGLKHAGVNRLVVVGGAASLEVAPGVELLDSPDFPAAWRPGAAALRDALAIYRTADLDWTFFSPAALISPGERTGKFRIGTDQLVTDEKGESRISAEDYAVALVDELEKPRFIRRRFTVAY